MSETLYPKRRYKKDKSHRRWRLDAELAYDGGGSQWSEYYRTKTTAKIAAFWHYHIASWGGNIQLVDTEA